MKISEMDVVYIVRNGEFNQELRHSLRSVAKNVPHRNIVIAGYVPRWTQNVIGIDVERQGNKYEQSIINWRAVMNDPRVSDDFVLMNDDFFIMNPITGVPDMHRGSNQAVLDYYAEIGSDYYRIMLHTKNLMKALNCAEGAFNYELHVPMVMNKQRYLEMEYMIRQHNHADKPCMTRTIYGNFYKVGGIEMDDVKIYGTDESFSKTGTFLSTSDRTFNSGAVGEYLRAKFNIKSKYER